MLGSTSRKKALPEHLEKQGRIETHTMWVLDMEVFRLTLQILRSSFHLLSKGVKLRGLDQDNEEVRLRLEDVGVFYEES